MSLNRFYKRLFSWDGTGPFLGVSAQSLHAKPRKHNFPKIHYLLNDPSTPRLKLKSMELPMPTTGLPVAIHGAVRNNNLDKPTHQEVVAAHAYTSVSNTTRYFQEMLVKCGRQPLKKWAGVPRLSIYPLAGKDLNAFYSRRAMKFFFAPVGPKKVLYTVLSSDIVTHETGHALLDAIRPDFWSVQALEIWSLHESFADIMAVVSIMQHDEVLNFALEEVDGDISKSNIFSRLAEEMGFVLYDLTKDESFANKTLRDAVNNFNYVDPKKLPKEGSHDQLVAECHSFGRIFLGAWYDIMKEIYVEKLNGSNDRQDQVKALKYARDKSFEYFLKGCLIVPRVQNTFQALAKVMIDIAVKDGEKYENIVRECLDKRELLAKDVKMLSSTTLAEVHEELQEKDVIFQQGENTIYKLLGKTSIRLSDYDDGVSALSVNGYDLANVEIEVPSDCYYKFNTDGVLVDEIAPTKEEILDAARMCVDDIRSSGDIGETVDTTWEVTDGKLVRTKIV